MNQLVFRGMQRRQWSITGRIEFDEAHCSEPIEIHQPMPRSTSTQWAGPGVRHRLLRRACATRRLNGARGENPLETDRSSFGSSSTQENKYPRRKHDIGMLRNDPTIKFFEKKAFEKKAYFFKFNSKWWLSCQIGVRRVSHDEGRFRL